VSVKGWRTEFEDEILVNVKPFFPFLTSLPPFPIKKHYPYRKSYAILRKFSLLLNPNLFSNLFFIWYLLVNIFLGFFLSLIFPTSFKPDTGYYPPPLVILC
jgi:hypothetical protein